MEVDIGIIFDCTIRNNGTASYCIPALKSIPGVTVTHYFPRGTLPKHDFYLYIDDGMDHISWLPPHPSAYWAIDTHLGYGYRVWKARQFDRAFVAQLPAVAGFTKDGVQKVQWLPLACHPEAHITRQQFIDRGALSNNFDLTEEWDWAFVGFMQDSRVAGHNNRIDHLDALQRALPNCRIAVNRFFESMALVYIKSRLGFNVSIKRDLNMRVFEVMSTGVPLLTNRDVDGLGELFTEGSDFIGYKGIDEMVEIAGTSLKNEALRRSIAVSGLDKVRSAHTYQHRMRTIIKEMSHV